MGLPGLKLTFPAKEAAGVSELMFFSPGENPPAGIRQKKDGLQVIDSEAIFLLGKIYFFSCWKNFTS